MKDQNKKNKTTTTLEAHLSNSFMISLLFGTVEELVKIHQDNHIEVDTIVESHQSKGQEESLEQSPLLMLMTQKSWAGSPREYHNDNEKALYLIRAGADVNHFITDHQDTVLHLAVNNAFVPTVKALIEAGADLNALDREGNSPLTWALLYCSSEELMQRRKEIFGLLLAAGATPPDPLRERVDHKGVKECSLRYFQERMETDAPYLKEMFQVYQERMELSKISIPDSAVAPATMKKALSL